MWPSASASADLLGSPQRFRAATKPTAVNTPVGFRDQSPSLFVAIRPENLGRKKLDGLM
jgi:hypothetical protein